MTEKAFPSEVVNFDAVVESLSGDAAGIAGRNFYFAPQLYKTRRVLFEHGFAAANVWVKMFKNKAYLHLTFFTLSAKYFEDD